MTYYMNHIRKLYGLLFSRNKGLNNELDYLVNALHKKKVKVEKSLEKAVQPSKKKSLRIELKIIKRQIEKTKILKIQDTI
jgi:hypothetical protein